MTDPTHTPLNTTPLGSSHTDFVHAFQHHTQVICRHGKSCTVHIVQAGLLIVNTYKIIACDPFERDRGPFTQSVPTGTYPVVLSVVEYGDGDRRVACAMLRFRETTPSRWELAHAPEDDSSAFAPGEFPGYGVEAGVGCFMDASVLQAIRDDFFVQPGEGLDALDRPDPFNDLLIERFSGEGVLLASIPLQSANGGNLIAFESGWGDGYYQSFFGFDEHQSLTCLVTDFLLLCDAHV